MVVYKCTNCNYSSKKWFGKCPHCGSFDIIEQDANLVVHGGQGGELFGKKKKVNSGIAASWPMLGRATNSIGIRSANEGRVKNITEILGENTGIPRVSTNFTQVDEVLSGLVSSGVYMLGGEPGVGKSTLAMQILGNIAEQGIPSIYVSAEESFYQVASRGRRVLSASQQDNVKILATNNIDKALKLVYSELANHHQVMSKAFRMQGIAGVVVFDSIQAFISDLNSGVVGGVSQVKEIAYKIVNFSKQTGAIAIIIGQVTKEGVLAGPKLAEHLVDTVAYLEHVDIGGVRLLRVIKNRFGQVGNVGFLTLGATGFKDAPDAYYNFLQSDVQDLTGTTFGVVMYGSRPLVVQVQALLIDTQFANPKRVVEGISRAKLELLVAVIEKKVPRVSLRAKDIFLKVLGGFNIKDACIDLAIVGALLSAYTGKVFKNTALIGEVGLLGDVRPCGALSMHKKEAKKLGIKKILDSKKIRHVSQLMRGLE